MSTEQVRELPMSAEQVTGLPTSTTPVEEDGLAKIVGHMAAVLGSEHFPTGDRALLRRINPDQQPPLAVYRFALRHLPDNWDHRAETRKNWLALVAGMALMSPGAHDPKTSLGTALGKNGYAESRLERLLSASHGVRRILLLRAARFLAAKGQPFNWVDGARLLLTQHDERREALYRHIARHFYRESNKDQ